jgi:hypothetical protein
MQLAELSRSRHSTLCLGVRPHRMQMRAFPVSPVVRRLSKLRRPISASLIRLARSRRRLTITGRRIIADAHLAAVPLRLTVVHGTNKTNLVSLPIFRRNLPGPRRTVPVRH